MSENKKIRKVKVLKGKAKIEAEKQGLSSNDLVIVDLEGNIEKIDGDPVSYLLKRQSEKKTLKELIENRNRYDSELSLKTNLHLFEEDWTQVEKKVDGLIAELQTKLDDLNKDESRIYDVATDWEALTIEWVLGLLGVEEEHSPLCRVMKNLYPKKEPEKDE